MNNKKTRGFVLTDWNLNDKDSYLEIMEKNGIQFLAFGEEVCPKSKRRHNQAFLYFFNPKSSSKTNLGKMGKFWGDTHCFVEPIYGNFVQNDAYCKKEGLYCKLGDEPQQGSRGDIRENINMINSGKIKPIELALIDPVSYNLYKNTYKDVHNRFMAKQFRTEMTRGFWYWGETGVGKSHKAFENFSPETHYIKDLNVHWWDNYEQQPIVVLNEFRGQVRFGELLDLCDKWPKTVPVRNNPSIPFISSKIIITSALPPEDVYHNTCDKDSLDQLLRRFKVVKLEKKKTKKKTEQKYSIGNIRTMEDYLG